MMIQSKMISDALKKRTEVSFKLNEEEKIAPVNNPVD